MIHVAVAIVLFLCLVVGYELLAEVHTKDTQIAKLEAVRDQAIANADKGIELLELVEANRDMFRRAAEILSDPHWERHWPANLRFQFAQAQALMDLEAKKEVKP